MSLRYCGACKNINPSFICGGCKKTAYCNKQCQYLDYGHHSICSAKIKLSLTDIIKNKVRVNRNDQHLKMRYVTRKGESELKIPLFFTFKATINIKLKYPNDFLITQYRGKEINKDVEFVFDVTINNNQDTFSDKKKQVAGGRTRISDYHKGPPEYFIDYQIPNTFGVKKSYCIDVICYILDNSIFEENRFGIIDTKSMESLSKLELSKKNDKSNEKPIKIFYSHLMKSVVEYLQSVLMEDSEVRNIILASINNIGEINALNRSLMEYNYNDWMYFINDIIFDYDYKKVDKFDVESSKIFTFGKFLDRTRDTELTDKSQYLYPKMVWETMGYTFNDAPEEKPVVKFELPNKSSVPVLIDNNDNVVEMSYDKGATIELYEFDQTDQGKKLTNKFNINTLLDVIDPKSPVKPNVPRLDYDYLLKVFEIQLVCKYTKLPPSIARISNPKARKKLIDVIKQTYRYLEPLELSDKEIELLLLIVYRDDCNGLSGITDTNDIKTNSKSNNRFIWLNYENNVTATYVSKEALIIYTLIHEIGHILLTFDEQGYRIGLEKNEKFEGNHEEFEAECTSAIVLFYLNRLKFISDRDYTLLIMGAAHYVQSTSTEFFKTTKHATLLFGDSTFYHMKVKGIIFAAMTILRILLPTNTKEPEKTMWSLLHPGIRDELQNFTSQALISVKIDQDPAKTLKSYKERVTKLRYMYLTKMNKMIEETNEHMLDTELDDNAKNEISRIIIADNFISDQQLLRWLYHGFYNVDYKENYVPIFDVKKRKRIPSHTSSSPPPKNKKIKTSSNINKIYNISGNMNEQSSVEPSLIHIKDINKYINRDITYYCSLTIKNTLSSHTPFSAKPYHCESINTTLNIKFEIHLIPGENKDSLIDTIICKSVEKKLDVFYITLYYHIESEDEFPRKMRMKIANDTYKDEFPIEEVSKPLIKKHNQIMSYILLNAKRYATHLIFNNKSTIRTYIDPNINVMKQIVKTEIINYHMNQCYNYLYEHILMLTLIVNHVQIIEKQPNPSLISKLFDVLLIITCDWKVDECQNIKNLGNKLLIAEAQPPLFKNLGLFFEKDPSSPNQLLFINECLSSFYNTEEDVYKTQMVCFFLLMFWRNLNYITVDQFKKLNHDNNTRPGREMAQIWKHINSLDYDLRSLFLKQSFILALFMFKISIGPSSILNPTFISMVRTNLKYILNQTTSEALVMANKNDNYFISGVVPIVMNKNVEPLANKIALITTEMNYAIPLHKKQEEMLNHFFPDNPFTIITIGEEYQKPDTLDLIYQHTIQHMYQFDE